MGAAGAPAASPPVPEPEPATGVRAGAAEGARPEAVEAAVADEASPSELPPVAELVGQLRPELLATMEELFRAQWSGVRRLRPEDLKLP